tara:strand:- start:2528 stop:4969 length:2442 start_codon:yes stop_codon:yes gene_type:complete
VKTKRPSGKARPDRNLPQANKNAKKFTQLLSSNWAPAAFFLFLSLVYFSGFVFSNDVIRGLDTGENFHQGNEPFMEKLVNLAVPENWNRYMGGTPTSGARQWQYFLPLHLISLFTSHHRYLGWRYLFAMFSAGYFMYLCIRGFGLRPLTALVTGTAYASAPTLMTFIYAGQDSKMLVIALFPLMVWGLHRGLETCRPVYFMVLALSVGAGIFTPHLQLVFYALWGLGIIFIFSVVAYYRKESDTGAAVRRSWMSAGAICLGLAVGSVGVFPAYWYTTTESRRAGEQGEGVGISYAQSWSLHPEEIASLLVPEFVHYRIPEGKNHYWGRNPLKLNSEYFGIAVIFLSLFALGKVRSDSRILLFLILFLFAIAFSLGPHTPVHGLLYRFIPGMKVLRVPGMIAFLFAFPACCLAAFGFDRLISDSKPDLIRKLTIGSAICVCLLLIVSIAPKAVLNMWTSVMWSNIPSFNLQIAESNLELLARGSLLSAVFLIILYVITLNRLKGTLKPALFAAILIPLMLVDTWRIDKQFLKYVNPDRSPPAERIFPDVVNHFRRDTKLYRTLVLPQIYFPKDLIDLANVFHHEPFSMQRFDRISTPLNRPPQELLGLLGNVQFLSILNLLNTKYIVSPQPVDAPGLSGPVSANRLHIYQNPKALPWFYLASDYVVENDGGAIFDLLLNPEFDPSATPIVESELPDLIGNPANTLESKIVQKEYDSRRGYVELEVSAGSPKLLVISENFHPFWSAAIDGNPASLFRANYVWKGLVVPAGKSTVQLTYRDPIAVACRWISLLSSVFLIGSIFWLHNRARTEASHA